MASVEITDNTIIRSLVRKGTNDERKQISLAEGELGFTTDTKRLYIGDGSGIGNATGVKYLGTVNDFTTVASLNPMPGDYFKLGSGLYARKNGYQGSVSLENDNAAVEAGYDKIGLAANIGDGLVLNNDNLNVNVDGVSILIDGNQLKVGEVNYDVLPDSSANSLLGNSSTDELPPTSISVNTNSVLGRTSGNVENVTFGQIVEIGRSAYSNSNPYNGNADIQQIGASVVNTDYSGSVTWAGLPHLKIGNTSDTFTTPTNCGLVKIMLQGGGGGGNSTFSGNAGGFLMFYAKIVPGSDIVYTIGNGGGNNVAGTSSEVTFTKYDSSTYTYVAQGGSYPVQPNLFVGTPNVFDATGALGDVFSITEGIDRNNNSKDRQPRTSSFFGNAGPGSGGMDASSRGMEIGFNGVIIIEYYQPI